MLNGAILGFMSILSGLLAYLGELNDKFALNSGSSGQGFVSFVSSISKAVKTSVSSPLARVKEFQGKEEKAGKDIISLFFKCFICLYLKYRTARF